MGHPADGVEWGAMKRTLRWLTIVVLLLAPGRALPGESVAGLPAPTGYVNDFAGVLSPETRQSLEELCTEVDHQAHAQIAVVTVQKLEADPMKGMSADQMPAPSIEEFAVKLEEKWKVGAKGTDRGVLVIFVMNPLPVHGRIEVGYGLEGILPDGKVGDIGREMKPVLLAGDLNQGVSLGVREIAQVIATDAGVTLAGLEGSGAPVRERYYSQPQAQMQVNPIVALVFGVILLLVIGTLIRTGHIGLLFFLLFNLMGGGGGGGGFGGGDNEGGGGFGGGGFGGFGGGGSGGGGANF